MDRMNDHVFYRNLRRFYPSVDRGEAIYIYDAHGKQYIDGAGGAAVVGADDVKRDHLLLAPPLVITEQQVDRMVSILDQTFAEISREI